MITQAFKFRWFELDGVKVAFDQYEVHDAAVNLIRKGLVTAILTGVKGLNF